MPGIRELLPEARFIHIIRDGRDVALSHKGLWFGPGESIEAQARFWIHQIASTRRDAAWLRHSYMEIRYEDLVVETEATLRKICDFLLLEFNPRMLNYHELAEERLGEIVGPIIVKNRPDISAEFAKSIHERTMQPPDRGRIGRWRAEMQETDLLRFEAIAGPHLLELGYKMSR